MTVADASRRGTDNPTEGTSNSSETASQPILTAEAVTVRFGGVVALQDVSIEVAAGRVTGIVGPNGAGKTTLFAVMSGLLRPDHGRVVLSGVDISRMGPHDRARRGIARTFQRVELFASLSVRDHLVLAQRLGNRYRHHRRATPSSDLTEDLIVQLGLTAVADLEAVTLPVGQARLVEVGRALATNPEVLLLDEPCSGLDADQQHRLIEVLLQWKDTSGVSLVIVEHNVDLVVQVSDCMYVLDMGQVISQGLPEMVVRDPAVQVAYLGDDFVTSPQSS